MNVDFLKKMAIQTENNNKVDLLSVRDIAENIRQSEFIVEMTNPTSEPINTKAVFIKGDRNTSLLTANIKFNGAAFDLTGYVVTANIKENENEIETYICEISSSVDGKVKIDVPSRYVDEEGIVTFELVFQKDTKLLFSQMYFYTVLGSLGEGNYGTESQMTALQQLIQQVQNKSDKVDEIVTDLNITQKDVDDIINMIGR